MSTSVHYNGQDTNENKVSTAVSLAGDNSADEIVPNKT